MITKEKLQSDLESAIQEVERLKKKLEEQLVKYKFHLQTTLYDLQRMIGRRDYIKKLLEEIEDE